jgi:hypothetical protein
MAFTRYWHLLHNIWMCPFMTLTASFYTDRQRQIHTSARAHTHTHTHIHTRLTGIIYQTVYPPSSHFLNILHKQFQNISYTNFAAKLRYRIRRSESQPVYIKLSKYKLHFWSFAIVFAVFQVWVEEEWGRFPVPVLQPNTTNKDDWTCNCCSLYIITIRGHVSY